MGFDQNFTVLAIDMEFGGDRDDGIEMGGGKMVFSAKQKPTPKLRVRSCLLAKPVPDGYGQRPLAVFAHCEL